MTPFHVDDLFGASSCSRTEWERLIKSTAVLIASPRKALSKFEWDSIHIVRSVIDDAVYSLYNSIMLKHFWNTFSSLISCFSQYSSKKYHYKFDTSQLFLFLFLHLHKSAWRHQDLVKKKLTLFRVIINKINKIRSTIKTFTILRSKINVNFFSSPRLNCLLTCYIYNILSCLWKVQVWLLLHDSITSASGWVEVTIKPHFYLLASSSNMFSFTIDTVNFYFGLN